MARLSKVILVVALAVALYATVMQGLLWRERQKAREPHWSRQEAKIGSLQAQVKAQQPQGVAPVPSAGAITWRASPIRSEVASTDTRVGITLNDGTAWTWIVRPEVRQERGKWSAALVIIPVDTKERGR